MKFRNFASSFNASITRCLGPSRWVRPPPAGLTIRRPGPIRAGIHLTLAPDQASLDQAGCMAPQGRSGLNGSGFGVVLHAPEYAPVEMHLSRPHSGDPLPSHEQRPIRECFSLGGNGN